MVLQKRLDYGFNGYQVPPTPRATRSARRRVPFRKKVDDNQLCAFDLLATVAGKLLLEGENAPSTTEMFTGTENCAVVKDSVKKEQLVENNPEKVKLCDEGSYGRNTFISEVDSQASVVKHSVKELSHVQNDACSGLTSVVTTSDCSEKFGSTTKLLNCESNIEHGNSATKVDVGSSRYSLSFGSKWDDTNKNHIKIEPPVFGKKAISVSTDICCSENLVIGDIKPPALASSDNSVKFPGELSFLDERPKKAFCTDHGPRGSFPAYRDNVKLVCRDDDENSSGWTQPGTLN